MSSREQRAVEGFHQAMGFPAPKCLDRGRGDLRCRLLEEEVAKLCSALQADDWLDTIDALVDILTVAYGTVVEMGVDLDPFFDEVHAANMRKVG